MRHEITRVLLTIVLLASFSLATIEAVPAPHTLAIAASSVPQEFTLIVSRYGFNGTADLSLTVQQGDTVQIRFVYGDGDLSTDNPHAIAIEGYGIKTVNIGKTNPTATVQFIADQTGTFKIYCYIPCEGMGQLLDGLLVVTPHQGPRISTFLNLAIASDNPDIHEAMVHRGHGHVVVGASLLETTGTPLIGRPVKFVENTTFGSLWLNTTYTDSTGEAFLHFAPTTIGTVRIVANYPGDAAYSNSSNLISFTVQSLVNVTGIEQPSFYGLRYPPNLAMIAVSQIVNAASVLIVGVLVLSIWSIYGYIGSQILRLPGRRSQTAEKKKHKEEP